MNAFKYNVKYQLNSLNSCQWSLNNNNRVASKPLEWGFLLQNLSFCLKNSARVHSYYLQYEPVQYESYIQGVFIFKVNSLRSWVKSPAVFVGFLGLRLFPLLLATQWWLPEKSGSKTPNMQLVACWFSLVASIYWSYTPWSKYSKWVTTAEQTSLPACPPSFPSVRAAPLSYAVECLKFITWALEKRSR